MCGLKKMLFFLFLSLFVEFISIRSYFARWHSVENKLGMSLILEKFHISQSVLIISASSILGTRGSRNFERSAVGRHKSKPKGPRISL